MFSQDDGGEGNEQVTDHWVPAFHSEMLKTAPPLTKILFPTRGRSWFAAKRRSATATEAS
eukprot:scaffold7056_cov245-Pinguiococcus_pyrenoidosus.AAC.3